MASKDAAWLTKELGKLLPEGSAFLVDMIVASEGADIIQTLEDLLPPDPTISKPAIAAVRGYLDARRARRTPAPPEPGMQLYRKDTDRQADTGGAARGSGAAAPRAPAGGEVLGIFKQGGKLKPTGGSKADVAAADSGSSAPAKETMRAVVNCLGCGRIFELVRNNVPCTHPDVIKFLANNGQCTFCGRMVPLFNRSTATDGPPAGAGSPGPSDAAASPAAGGSRLPAAVSSPGAAGTSAAPSSSSAATTPSTLAAAAPPVVAGGSSAADEAAMAFKNRLVMYDRESAKRTTVIDDQSDYFEVDTNAWLSDTERQQMRDRRRLEEEAEKARRQRVAVTIDLLGRRVMVADAAATLDGSGPSFRTGTDALASAYVDSRRADTAGTMWTVPAGEAAAAAALRQQRLQAAAAPAGAAGAAGAAVAAADTVREASERLRTLRATTNPNIPTAAPKYVRSGASAGEGVNGHHAQRGAAAPQGQQQQQRGVPRLQDDMNEVFEEFQAELLHADEMEAALAAEAAAPFDICPPAYVGLAAPQGPASLPTLPREVKDVSASSLPPGLVVLRGWLSLAVQQELLAGIRQLGMAPGGFYTPTYGQGRVMHLRMMCMGVHWEPRSHSYVPLRDADGATPPPLPDRYKELCNQALAAANIQAEQHQGVTLPSLSPDICLVNWYEKNGRLGLHQDKDETSDSLRRGTPVVSFSLGDTCDFLFGSSADEASAQSVRLMSGDVLVFGGPSRMVFHGVPTIYPNTAPGQLVTTTGLRPGRLNMTFRQL